MDIYRYIFKTKEELFEDPNVFFDTDGKMTSGWIIVHKNEEGIVTQSMLEHLAGQVVPENNCRYFGDKIRPWMCKPVEEKLSTEEAYKKVSEKHKTSLDKLGEQEMKEKEFKITLNITIDGHEYKMTVEEAKRLQTKLNELFPIETWKLSPDTFRVPIYEPIKPWEYTYYYYPNGTGMTNPDMCKTISCDCKKENK